MVKCVQAIKGIIADVKVSKLKSKVSKFFGVTESCVLPKEHKVSQEDICKIKEFLKNTEKRIASEPNNVELRQYYANVRDWLDKGYNLRF